MEYDLAHLSEHLDRLIVELIDQLGKIPWYEEEQAKIDQVDAAARSANQPLFLASGRVFCRVQEATGGVEAWLTRLLIDETNQLYAEYDDDPRIVALVNDLASVIGPESSAKTTRTGIALTRLFPISVDADAVLSWARDAFEPLRAIAENANRRLSKHNELIRNVSDQHKAVIQHAAALNATLGEVAW